MDLLHDENLSKPEDLLPTPEEGLLSDKAGTVLVAALEHPEKRIRYHAAVTLAKLDPQVVYYNAEKVIPLLSQASGEWGMKTVLVVEPDYRYRNMARDTLMKQGYLVFTAQDGFEAMQMLAQTPIKDAVFIAGDLPATLKDEWNITIDVPEQTPFGWLKPFAHVLVLLIFQSLSPCQSKAMKLV